MTDLPLTHATRPAPAAPVLDLFGAWRWLRREWRLQKTIGTLHRLDDRTLRDIGVECHHISDIVRERGLSE